jgi:NitT/TauT family transport system permease protein
MADLAVQPGLRRDPAAGRDAVPAATSGQADDVFLVDPSVKARKREIAIVAALRIAVGLLLVGGWQLASGRLASEFWISSPAAVVMAVGRLWAEADLLASIIATVGVALAGFAAGALSGMVVGLVFGINRIVARVLDPYLVGFYSMPRLALIPLFILWFGIGFETKVIFTALLVFFPIFMNTLSGTRSVDTDLIDVLRVMGASRVDTIAKVLVPAALSWVFAGLRISAPYALIGAIVAEMFTSNVGLGYLISKSANQFDTAGLFATLLVTTVLALVLNQLVALAEARLLRWRPVGLSG